MKKIIAFMVIALTVAMFAGCAGNAKGQGAGTITVVSRENGSGTRGAFIELTGVLEKDAQGNKKDLTTSEAIIANKTDVMLANVAGDPNAIGYVSLGSLNDTVKALKVDGTQATPENVKNGSYKISRPFLIATKTGLSQLGSDFVSYVLSKQGQAIVTKSGYIAVSEAAAEYVPSSPAGKLVIAGSSSVSPVMEKLVEAYKGLNTAAQIEIQTTDSTSGMNSVMEGSCDIGMSSRELKESELKVLTPTQIAMDGIAIIVNKENAAENITNAQIKDIYTGKITDWDAVK